MKANTFLTAPILSLGLILASLPAVANAAETGQCTPALSASAQPASAANAPRTDIPAGLGRDHDRARQPVLLAWDRVGAPLSFFS